MGHSLGEPVRVSRSRLFPVIVSFQLIDKVAHLKKKVENKKLSINIRKPYLILEILMFRCVRVDFHYLKELLK